MIRWSSSAKREIRLLSLLILLVLCLFALSLGLDSLRLQRGFRLAGPDRVETEAADTAPAETADDASMPWTTLALASAALIVGAIGLIVSRRMRRTFLMYLYGGLIFVGTFVLVAMALSQLSFDPSQGGPGSQVLDELPQAPPAAPSRGLIRATAFALAALVVGATVFLGLRLRRATHEDDPVSPALLDDLIESASVAAESIRQGHDPRGAVIDCYRRMLRLLEERGATARPYLTPREFAHALQGEGVPVESVKRLTDLFELVRYGGRSDEALSRQAAECLEAVARTPYSEHPPAPAGGVS